MAIPQNKTIALPDWVGPFVEGWQGATATDEDRMRLAVALSAENVRHRSGGPFAAVVFESETGRVVAVGVNVVVPQHASMAHGEVVALLLAQEALKTHDLGSRALPRLEMATSAQPCIQCYGSIIWSGIARVLVGARAEDIESIVGFDEGPVPEDWVPQWSKRGIAVKVDLLREEACAVLRSYRDSGAPVYNSETNPKV